jgi:hypothetical protein
LVAPRIAVAAHVLKHSLQLRQTLFGLGGALMRHCEGRCIPCCVATHRIGADRCIRNGRIDAMKLCGLNMPLAVLILKCL